MLRFWRIRAARISGVDPLPNSRSNTFCGLSSIGSGLVCTYGSPGGQSAYDALSNPALAVPEPWTGTPYLATLVSTYTVIVPEPASLGGIALAGLALLARRRGAIR